MIESQNSGSLITQKSRKFSLDEKLVEVGSDKCYPLQLIQDKRSSGFFVNGFSFKE